MKCTFHSDQPSHFTVGTWEISASLSLSDPLTSFRLNYSTLSIYPCLSIYLSIQYTHTYTMAFCITSNGGFQARPQVKRKKYERIMHGKNQLPSVDLTRTHALPLLSTHILLRHTKHPSSYNTTKNTTQNEKQTWKNNKSKNKGKTCAFYLSLS